jgi:hypothetical protein
MSHHAQAPAIPPERARTLAQGLGWFSIALGATQLLAPKALARWLGMSGSERLLQAYGLREIGTGFGILASREPAGWIWGRVAGDSLDVATLASQYNRRNANRGNVSLALAAVLGVTLLDVLCAQSLAARNGTPRQRQAMRDYSRRSGFRRPAHAMRGAARDFQVPDDMRTPRLLRPFPGG